MTKQSYRDPVKSVARKKWRRFLEKNMKGRPSGWRVACFPWGDADHSYEIEEVYDPLGIPRQNIVGIERDPDKLERLRTLGLGIELFNGPDLAFFQTQDRKFDIVNLDYDGTFNDWARLTLLEVSSKRRLTGRATLGVTVLGRREDRNNTAFYRGQADITTRMTNDLLRLFGHATGKTYQPSRDEVMSYYTNAVMVQPNSIGRNNPLVEQLMRTGIPPQLAGLQHSDPEVRMWAVNKLHEFLKAKDVGGFVNEEGLNLLASLAIVSSENPYLLRRNERYSYLSENGSPMLVDFFLFEEMKTVSRFKYLIDSINGNTYFNPLKFFHTAWGIVPFDPNSMRKLAQQMDEDSEIIIEPEFPPRIHLGSSYKPKPRLKGEKYYELRKAGATDQEILESHKTTARQIAAFRAHVTMGTYGPPVIDESEKIAGLSTNGMLRAKYFVDDIAGMAVDGKTIAGILEAAKDVMQPGITDMQAYTLFSDIELCVRKGYVPDAAAIGRIYDAVVSGDMAPEVKKFTAAKRKLTKESVGNMMEQYMLDGITITLGDIAQEGDNRQIVAMLMANWLNDHPETGYVKKLVGGKPVYTPKSSKPNGSKNHDGPALYIDNRGVPHKTPQEMAEANRGYR